MADAASMTGQDNCLNKDNWNSLGWIQLWSLMDQRGPATVSYFQENTQGWGLNNVTSCLSVGPGHSDLDVQLMNQCMPECSTYIGVEKDHILAQHLKSQFQEKAPHVQSTIITSPIERYKGPEQEVDAILLLNVLHFVAEEEREAVIRRCWDWLSPGGVILLQGVGYKETLKKYKLNEIMQTHTVELLQRLDLGVMHHVGSYPVMVDFKNAGRATKCYFARRLLSEKEANDIFMDYVEHLSMWTIVLWKKE